MQAGAITFAKIPCWARVGSAPGVTSGAIGAAAYYMSLLESFLVGSFFSWMFGFKFTGAVLPPEAGDKTVCS